jgi:hypothetical protein
LRDKGFDPNPPNNDKSPSRGQNRGFRVYKNFGYE